MIDWQACNLDVGTTTHQQQKNRPKEYPSSLPRTGTEGNMFKLNFNRMKAILSIVIRLCWLCSKADPIRMCPKQMFAVPRLRVANNYYLISTPKLHTHTRTHEPHQNHRWIACSQQQQRQHKCGLGLQQVVIATLLVCSDLGAPRFR